MINEIPVLPIWRPERPPAAILRVALRAYEWARWNTITPQLFIGRWWRYGWGRGPEFPWDWDELLRESAIAVAIIVGMMMIITGGIIGAASLIVG